MPAERGHGADPVGGAVDDGGVKLALPQASTASRALPPRRRTRIPAGRAASPFPLATIVGVTRVAGTASP